MSDFTITRCPNKKCNSFSVFRSFNKNTKCDDGVCRECFHKSDFDDFIEAGVVFDTPERDFDKDRFYEFKEKL